MNPGDDCGGGWTSDGSTAVNFSGWAAQVWASPPARGCRPAYRPAVRMGEITDGASNTLLVGEKSLGVAYYDSYNQDSPVYGTGANGLSLWFERLPVHDRDGRRDFPPGARTKAGRRRPFPLVAGFTAARLNSPGREVATPAAESSIKRARKDRHEYTGT